MDVVPAEDKWHEKDKDEIFWKENTIKLIAMKKFLFQIFYEFY